MNNFFGGKPAHHYQNTESASKLDCERINEDVEGRSEAARKANYLHTKSDWKLKEGEGMLHQYSEHQQQHQSLFSNPFSSHQQHTSSPHYSPLTISPQIQTSSTSEGRKSNSSEKECYLANSGGEEVEGACFSSELGDARGLQVISESDLDAELRAAEFEKLQNDSSQQNNEQNNNLPQDEKVSSFDFPELSQILQETEQLPFLDLDMETIINGSVDEEYKRKIQTTANEIDQICDENDPNFRLPGFHQAFGSTEIGRFLHHKDFVLPQPMPSDPTQYPCKVAAQMNGISVAARSSPKPKSKYSRKSKTNATDRAWNFDNVATCSTPSAYYKRKERKKAAQQEAVYSDADFYRSGKDFRSCTSPYCSEYSNCDYYRQQYQYPAVYQPSYYGSNAEYQPWHAWRNERYFPYTEQRRQSTSTSYYPHYMAPSQAMPPYNYANYQPTHNYNYS